MTTKTHLTMTATKKPEGDEPEVDKLRLRAARFALPNPPSSSSVTTTTTTKTAITNPADAEKLAARAAKFADVKGFTGSPLGSTTAVAGSSYPADAEKLAKRAARFGDIKVDTPRVMSKKSGGSSSQSSSTVPASTGPVDKELLAKRAARFAKSNLFMSIILIIAIIIIENSSTANTLEIRDEFHEDLFIKPLEDGKLFAQFRFETLYRKDIKSLRWENKIEIFPLSLVDLVANTDLNRLHFSLTKGNWNYQKWGYSTRPSPPGAQVRVQFSRHNENRERSWARLVNSLSGKFCASIASADKKTLVSSKLTFGHHSSLLNSTGHTLYTNLPEETLCTENLTPWKKLLPCYSKSGLASLLNAVNLLKSSYSSLAIDIEPKPCIVDGQVVVGCERVLLTQTISIVFNPLLLFEGKQTWSLAKIFGNSIPRVCPLASHSRIHVDITKLDDKSKLYPQTYEEHSLSILNHKFSEIRKYATFDLNALLSSTNTTEKITQQQINIGIKQNQIFKQTPASSRSQIPVHFMTHVAGVGAGDGTIVATINNYHEKPIRATYMDVIPHFLRVYLHTLTIRTTSGQELKPDKLNFVLSKDTNPTLIEFSIVIPPMTSAQISYDFERAFLRWTDYKPDANKGVLLGSAVLGVSLRSSLEHLVFPVNSVASDAKQLIDGSGVEGDMLIFYARPLLFILPTPDFSMPYNVICLVCNTIVASFGVMHNLTTRKPVVKFKKQTDVQKDESNETKKDQ